MSGSGATRLADKGSIVWGARCLVFAPAELG